MDDHTGSDKIIEIKGRKDPDFTDLRIVAGLSKKDERIPLTVQRSDERIESLQIVAESLPGLPLKGLGIYPPTSLTIAQVSDKETLQERTGLLPGDVVFAADGQEVATSWELEDVIENTLAPLVTLLAKRRISEIQEGERTETIQTSVSSQLPAEPG